jgi:hypothetical protein
MFQKFPSHNQSQYEYIRVHKIKAACIKFEKSEIDIFPYLLRLC